MVKCPECGKELKENFKKCPNCGHAVSKDTGERDFLIAKILAVAAIHSTHCHFPLTRTPHLQAILNTGPRRTFTNSISRTAFWLKI